MIDSAWQDHGTRRLWQRAAGWALLWIVLAGCLLVMAVYNHSRSVHNAATLRRIGVHVVGVALNSAPSASKCPQVPVRVSYRIFDTPRTGTLWVDACDEHLTRGQSIDLYVDPRHPSRFVGATINNESETTLYLNIAGAISAPLLLLAAAVRLSRLTRVRAVLQHAQWTEHTVRVVRIPQRIVRNSKVLLITYPGSDRVFKLPFTAADYADLPSGQPTPAPLAVYRDRFVIRLKNLYRLNEVKAGTLKTLAIEQAARLDDDGTTTE